MAASPFVREGSEGGFMEFVITCFALAGALIVTLGIGEIVTRWRERRRQRFLKTGKKR